MFQLRRQLTVDGFRENTLHMLQQQKVSGLHTSTARAIVDRLVSWVFAILLDTLWLVNIILSAPYVRFTSFVWLSISGLRMVPGYHLRDLMLSADSFRKLRQFCLPKLLNMFITLVMLRDSALHKLTFDNDTLYMSLFLQSMILGKFSHVQYPVAFVTKQYNLVLVGGLWCSELEK